MLAAIHRQLKWEGAGLLVLLSILLALAPAEQTLGQTVKLVYLHGALARTALLLFLISLPLNLFAFVRERAAVGAWGQSLVWAATALWLAHLLLSMITTRAAWGVYVAWFEPRTRFTFLLGAASLLILAAAYLVDDRRFTALAYAILAAAATALQPLLGTIQHPLNPIGASPSLAIRTFYAAILVVCLALGALLTLWLHQRLAGRA